MYTINQHFAFAIKVGKTSFGLLEGINRVSSGSEALISGGMRLLSLKDALEGLHGIFQCLFIDTF